MYLKLIAKSLNEGLGVTDDRAKLSSLNYKEVKYVYRKNDTPVIYIEILNLTDLENAGVLEKEGNSIVENIKEDCKQYEELTYYIYSETLLAKSLEGVTLEKDSTSTEQERLKKLVDEGYWGVKYNSNIENI